MARRDRSALAKRLINAWVSWNESSPFESHFMQTTAFFGVLCIDSTFYCFVTVCPHNAFAIEKTLRSLDCDCCDWVVFSVLGLSIP
ncbi:hypothetical protein [Synechococcus sp. MU1655]|uniref:hypothetical protein n=1 Tax=Synechococcus sp. MU1655 TaxID=2508355 RepID=UPI002026E751|nr:hypothetical protein [Synechococcus sp. MU1655]